ncbi:MAG: hypothetical protein JWN32_4205, partial [Solirubrobacterales bacterium]|nr:hypothetical protein [Solirubrobacterales bacterium]
MSQQTVASNVPVLEGDGFLSGMAGDTAAYYEEIRAVG